MLDQDRGLLYAEACFETVRVAETGVFRWPGHMGRLARGLEAFGLAMPPGMGEQLLERVLEAARDVRGAHGTDALVRVTLTGGVAGRGLMPPGASAGDEREPACHVHAWPWRDAPPVRLRAATWPLPLAARPAKWTSDYGASIRALHALRAAGQLGADEEALALDADGRVVSAPTANVALFVDGRWVTPRLGAGVLPGVVRAALLEAGALAEADCDAAMLARCEAVALTSSGAFIRPAATLDGRPLLLDESVFAPLWAALQGQPGAPARAGEAA